jgi:hypothetical protein
MNLKVIMPWPSYRLGNERRTCGPGDVVVIPPGVEHEAFFHEDTEVIGDLGNAIAATRIGDCFVYRVFAKNS